MVSFELISTTKSIGWEIQQGRRRKYLMLFVFKEAIDCRV
jgi:hypothetical protein